MNTQPIPAYGANITLSAGNVQTTIYLSSFKTEEDFIKQCQKAKALFERHYPTVRESYFCGEEQRIKIERRLTPRYTADRREGSL